MGAILLNVAVGLRSVTSAEMGLRSAPVGTATVRSVDTTKDTVCVRIRTDRRLCKLLGR